MLAAAVGWRSQSALDIQKPVLFSTVFSLYSCGHKSIITGGDDSAKRSFGIPEYSAWNTFWAMNVIHIYLFVCINCEQVIFMYLSRNTKTRRLSLHGLTTDISVTGKWRRSCGQKISAGGCRLTMNSFLCGAVLLGCAGLGCWAGHTKPGPHGGAGILLRAPPSHH